MGFKCGLIGLPNVGKSTLFNKLTNLKVPSENFPFCTITPNLGVVPIYDIRLKVLAKIVNSKKIIPTVMEFVDIAGLVKGSYNGEGLGNKFLENIRQVDVLIHVVRCFSDLSIVHVYNKLDPIFDIKLINDELIFSDYFSCEKMLLKYKKNIRSKNSDYQNAYQVLKVCFNYLKEGKKLININFNKYEKNIVQSFNFLTNKPMMFVINIDKNHIKNDKFEKLLNYLKLKKCEVVPFCCISKSFSENNNIEYKKIFSDNNFQNEQLNKIVFYGYNLLNLQTFFTVGKKEVRGWTINKKTTAVDAAKKIHTDFKKGFIRAKIISYEDFVKYNGELGSKKFGKYRIEGKNYLVKDGDIINFLFHV